MLVKLKLSFFEMSQCLPAVWSVCKQPCCWCQPEPPRCVSMYVCVFVRAYFVESQMLSRAIRALVRVVLTKTPAVHVRAAPSLFLGVCVFPRGSLWMLSPVQLPLCVCLCVRDISFCTLTGWRICAVIVVWLSSCCNWKCLVWNFLQDV